MSQCCRNRKSIEVAAAVTHKELIKGIDDKDLAVTVWGADSS
jgi:hypothetical protein